MTETSVRKITTHKLLPWTREGAKAVEAETDRIWAAVPSHWLEVSRGPNGSGYRHKIAVNLTVIFGVDYFPDGHLWQHASIAWTDRMPTYDDLCKLKAEFIGGDRKAVMVLPAEPEHVNIHPYCLHLYCRLDGDPLPDFTFGGKMI